MLTIGVAVPCYRPHLDRLPLLLDSIEAQTRKPDHVVVQSSGTSAADLAPIKRDWSFRLDIYPVEQRRNAAQNRNAAARHLDTDVISYIDADDTMHPQRLEMIADAFERTGVDLVLHGCLSPPQDDYYAPFREVPRPWPVAVNPPSVKRPAGSRFEPHHGQATVTRSIAQTIGHPENLSFERREDSEFVNALVAMPGVRSAFIDLGLTKYLSAGEWEGAPAGSGEYELTGMGALARRVMNTPGLNLLKAPVQAFWRQLPTSVRKRLLK